MNEIQKTVLNNKQQDIVINQEVIDNINKNYNLMVSDLKDKKESLLENFSSFNINDQETLLKEIRKIDNKILYLLNKKYDEILFSQ